jgi:alpha-L-fucosidase
MPVAVNSSTWTRHREVYGENVVYDDFIANFTAANWNPDDWTDLFANSGAKYFTVGNSKSVYLWPLTLGHRD